MIFYSIKNFSNLASARYFLFPLKHLHLKVPLQTMSSYPSTSLSESARKRLLKEYQMLEKDKSLGITVKLNESQNNENRLDVWDLYIEGAENSLYEGYIIHAKMFFPPQYPYQPPKFVFISPIYHPNVYKDGTVCISILHTDQDELIDADIHNCTWSPAFNVGTICISIISLLNEPNIYSAANVDASKEFRDDLESYKSKVKALLAEKCQKVKEKTS